jgi:hypothetical protein
MGSSSSFGGGGGSSFGGGSSSFGGGSSPSPRLSGGGGGTRAGEVDFGPNEVIIEVFGCINIFAPPDPQTIGGGT